MHGNALREVVAVPGAVRAIVADAGGLSNVEREVEPERESPPSRLPGKLRCHEQTLDAAGCPVICQPAGR